MRRNTWLLPAGVAALVGLLLLLGALQYRWLARRLVSRGGSSPVPDQFGQRSESSSFDDLPDASFG